MKTLADKKMIAPVNSKGDYKDVLKVSDVKATIERIKEKIVTDIVFEDYYGEKEILDFIDEEVGEL